MRQGVGYASALLFTQGGFGVSWRGEKGGTLAHVGLFVHPWTLVLEGQLLTSRILGCWASL